MEGWPPIGAGELDVGDEGVVIEVITGSGMTSRASRGGMMEVDWDKDGPQSVFFTDIELI